MSIKVEFSDRSVKALDHGVKGCFEKLTALKSSAPLYFYILLVHNQKCVLLGLLFVNLLGKFKGFVSNINSCIGGSAVV